MSVSAAMEMRLDEEEAEREGVPFTPPTGVPDIVDQAAEYLAEALGVPFKSARAVCRGLVNRRRRHRAEVLDPYAIKVPEPLVRDIDEQVNLTSARLGEAPADVRRGVELAILQRGIAALKGAEGKR